ncbi:MAG TPA: tetratricopeptide repeat protein [Acidobacteriota bacterium]|nr:tetratricopeptide repeat protein [Acidobacteriota bacterium]
MGKTKLTRKEIIGDNPIHDAVMRAAEFLRAKGTAIVILIAVIVIAVIAGFFVGKFLDGREYRAQGQLARGIDFFHGQVSPDATDNPYEKGAVPVFRSETEKYQAAAAEFEPIATGYAYGDLSIIARYYLGLVQLRLGEEDEAVNNLQMVANNSKNRTIGFLARKVLARAHIDSGDLDGARELLSGILNDPQYKLSRDDTSIELSRVLVAQGRHDEAVKVLEDAVAQGLAFSEHSQRLVMELERLQNTVKAGTAAQSVQP